MAKTVQWFTFSQMQLNKITTFYGRVMTFLLFKQYFKSSLVFFSLT